MPDWRKLETRFWLVVVVVCLAFIFYMAAKLGPDQMGAFR